MSDPEPEPTPEPTPKPAAPARPQKQVSGFLIFSLMLSLGGLFFRPLLGIGPLIGLVLAFIGRKKAKADPMVIGPRLALWCVGIAVVTFGIQIFVLVRAMPGQAWWQTVAGSQYEFIETLRTEDYDRLLDLMDPDEGAYTDADSLETALSGVFPEEALIDYDKVSVRREAFDEKVLEAEIQEFLSKSEGEFRFTLPVRFPAEGADIDLDFDMRSRRLGYAKFESFVRDVKFVEAPPEKSPPEDGPGEVAPPVEEKTGD